MSATSGFARALAVGGKKGVSRVTLFLDLRATFQRRVALSPQIASFWTAIARVFTCKGLWLQAEALVIHSKSLKSV